MLPPRHTSCSRSRTRSLAAILSLSLFAASSDAADPSPPPDGFLIQQDTNLSYTWTDGYQVLMDVRYPTDPSGPRGWPLVVLVHGGGGQKSVVAGASIALAKAGYITLAYDVRGQGPSMLSNPSSLGNDFLGLRELIDLFEAMEAAEAMYPLLVDFDRIGVTGYSQGGRHAWWGAMHSGRTPPPNPWRVAAFPLVDAVVVKDNAAGSGGSGDAFSAPMVEKLFSSTGITYQPAIVSTLQALVLAEDFAGLSAATTVPGMDATVLLPQTTVPVFAHASFDDKKVNPSGVLASWNLLPATTPKRLQLGTSGHDSPQNDQDGDLYTQTRQRWFDRFLKSEMNGVDTEPAIRAAVTPADAPTYTDPKSLWDFREHTTLPDPAVVTTRAYFANAGVLSPTAPGAATASSLNHNVPAAFDVNAYTALLPNAVQLQAIINPATITYDSPPLAKDTHVEGIATIQLATTTNDPDYQIHAVLFDVAPAGQTRFVTRGEATQIGAAGPGNITISTYLQSYVFQKGHRVRVQLENLGVHRPPTGSAPYLKTVPYFTSSTVLVREGGATPSYLDLPTLPYVAPTLTTYPLAQSVAAAENQRLKIHSNANQAGSPYLVLGTLAGTTPSTVVAGATLPIAFDALTWALAANPGMPPFVGMFGALDALGSADAGILLGGFALPPTLIGVEISIAALVAGTPNTATNAVTIPFVD